MKPSDIKNEIEASKWLAKWLKKKPLKRVGVIVLIIFVVISYLDVVRYSKARNLAVKIFPEILANVKEIEMIDRKKSDPSWILDKMSNQERYEHEMKSSFVFESYEKNYGCFGKSQLDMLISSFYTNLKKYNSDYSSEDTASLIDQGKAALKLINYYFGCDDFFATRNQQRNIVSGNTVAIVFSLSNYLNYKFR